VCVCVCVMVPAANTTAIGLDTIEEEEEKARFFAQLEAGALTTIDYSILNRELDSTTSNLRYVSSLIVISHTLSSLNRSIKVSLHAPFFSGDNKSYNRRAFCFLDYTLLVKFEYSPFKVTSVFHSVLLWCLHTHTHTR